MCIRDSNINAQSQSIPNTVLLAYVGRDYVLQINQALSTTTWIYLGYWNATYGNPYNGTAVPEDMSFRVIGHTTKNGSTNEDCYLIVRGHVSTDSFGVNIDAYYYGGGGICPIQITVRRGTQGANPTVGYHFFAQFLNTSYGTRLISDSNAFIFDGGVQGSFNPNLTFGAITIYPCLLYTSDRCRRRLRCRSRWSPYH